MARNKKTRVLNTGALKRFGRRIYRVLHDRPLRLLKRRFSK